MNKPFIIAYYLPQFYTFQENDDWWGAGFTEWTNVSQAKKLFKGHYQPRIPADLGFYDLRVSETRKRQAELAKQAGISAFCYWHYWFDEKHQLMHRVFDEVLESGEPNFQFCLGWANHSWYAKTWKNDVPDKLLIEQKYEGEKDFRTHFEYALKAFKDKRYVRIDNKPIFYIYNPLAVPQDFFNYWNKWAKEEGLQGICFIGRSKNDEETHNIIRLGFSFTTTERMMDIYARQTLFVRIKYRLIHLLKNRPKFYFLYKDAMIFFLNEEDKKPYAIPTLIPCWDHSARSKKRGTILHDSTPEYWRKHINSVLSLVKEKDENHQLVFLKSWNEWAEGNYMEPDIKWGHKYIDVLGEEVRKYRKFIKHENII